MEEPKWSDNRYPRIDFQVRSPQLCFASVLASFACKQGRGV